MSKIDKYANLYDYEGNLIEKGPLKNKSLTEIEQLVDNLTVKVKDDPDNKVYKVYLNNAQKFLFAMYNGMNREQLMERLSALQDAIAKAKEEVKDIDDANLKAANDALDELKENIESSKSDSMDEYVPFEEVKGGE